jgi:hypothetical protein
VQISIEGVDRSSSYMLEEFAQIEIVRQADFGEVGFGTAPIPSSTPSTEAYSGQRFLAVSAGVTILDGFIGPMNRDRNGVVNGNRLVFHYNIGDENALLGGHRAVSWVRPEETDRARMLAAITTYLGYLSLNTSMVLDSYNETIPAKTYMTEDLFGELQADCGDPTAKELFIENRRIHWHRQTQGDPAGIAIVASGENRVTTFALESASPPQRSKDGMDLATDVLARNTTGSSYTATDSAAQTRHDSAGIRHERLIEQEGATLAQLTSLATRMLDTYKTERITYEGTIGPLTSAQVALIPPGSLITATDTVWGLTASVQRIAGLRLKYVHPDRWMATLQLGYVPRLRVRPLKVTSSSSVGTGGDSGGGGGGGDACCPPWNGIGSPSSGQDVINELDGTGNGSTTSWVTAFPYVPGSLSVWVAGLNVTSHKTETTPTTGAWGLDFAPTTGQTIRVNYTAA